jgi:regulatory protein
VLASAVRALESRQLSVSELRLKLRRLGYMAELIDGAVTRLAELGYLDDDAFARSWVESRDRARPRGERALRSELGRKGVDRAVVEAVLDGRRTRGTASDESGPSPDEVAAVRLIERHAAALARVSDPRARRQRAYGLLARNGFDPDIAARISRTVDVAAAEERLEDD